jgi:copper homeostasis protein
METKVLVEVCANSVESALAAQAGGAGRVELCANLMEGGTTPSYASIEIAREKLSIALNVLIRPRGGDFLYNDIEFSIMRRDIEICKDLKVDGVVIGILDKDGNIDMPRMQDLVSLARPMTVTFHRAFDMCNDPFRALQLITGLGIERILTSGQKDKAMEGIPLITQLVSLAEGKVLIMPGGGLNRLNVSDMILYTGVRELHLTGKRQYQSRMSYRNPSVSMGGVPGMPEYMMEVTDAEEIKHVVDIVNYLANK